MKNIDKKEYIPRVKMNLQLFAKSGEGEETKKDPQDIDIKSILTNIETGVKKSGTKIEGFEKNMEELKTRMDGLEVKAQQINTQPKIEVKDNHFQGQKMARLWKAEIVAQQEKKSRMEVLESMYGRDTDFINEVKSMTSSGNAGIMIDEAYFNEIIPLLYNALTVMDLGGRKVPMPNGNLNIRKMIQGTTASYIGETKATKASKARFASARLSAKKLAVKAVFSNDLLRSESATADQMVRDDMMEQMQVGMDYTALYGLGTEYTPRGIINTPGVNKVTSTAILDGDGLYTDMVVPIKKANIKMLKPGWIFNPDVFALLYNETFANGLYKYRDELKTGKFHGFQFKESNQIETGTDAHAKVDIFFGDYSKFAVGEQVSLEIKTSDDSTYLDEDGNQVSSGDTDETVVRGLMIHDMALTYGKAFSVGNYYTK